MATGDGKAIGRRGFLGLLATGGFAAAGTAAVVAETASTGSETRAEKSKGRYRVTDDVAAFYRVNRYPVRKD